MNLKHVFIASLAVAVASCTGRTTDGGKWQARYRPGWHQNWETYGNGVKYGFNDKSHSIFWGGCDRQPYFFLDNGDYSSDAKTYVLNVDGRKWRLEAWRDEHGRGLIIDDEQAIDALYRAKRVVSFRVDADGWTRTFVPSAYLSRMIRRCRVLRIIDPDNTGIPYYRRILLSIAL
jgi:hypothetical protein